MCTTLPWEGDVWTGGEDTRAAVLGDATFGDNISFTPVDLTPTCAAAEGDLAAIGGLNRFVSGTFVRWSLDSFLLFTEDDTFSCWVCIGMKIQNK